MGLLASSLRSRTSGKWHDGSSSTELTKVTRTNLDASHGIERLPKKTWPSLGPHFHHASPLSLKTLELVPERRRSFTRYNSVDLIPTLSGMFRSATWLLRSKSQLQQVLDATFRASSSPNNALLYALSSNASDLDDILHQLSGSAPETLGCIASPLPFHPQSAFADGALFSCALAIVDRETCVPFALENHGEGPVQVGRWHTFRKKDVKEGGMKRLLEQNGDWNDVWKGSRDMPALPEELQDRRYVINPLGSAVD